MAKRRGFGEAATLLAVRDGKLDFQFTFRNSIEHFYPQHPDTELQAAYAQLVDVEDRDRFGNLALVTVRDNSKFTNSLPKVKTEFLHIVEQSPKLGEMAKRGATWGSAEILAHHRDMVAMLWRDVTRS